MSINIEPRDEARRRRMAVAGQVDFTMMYIAHDAFNRDMVRLVNAAERGDGLSPAAVATWQLFSKQLHTHHTAEDTAIWPRLRAAVTDPAEVRILDEMEAEHAALDPRVEQIDAAVAHRNEAALATELNTLGQGLSIHMAHEETEALPLLEKHLGAAGWEAFGKEIREQVGGMKAGAEYLPWVLDGATEQTTKKVLKMLPPPARLLYRRVWEPRARAAGRLP